MIASGAKPASIGRLTQASHPHTDPCISTSPTRRQVNPPLAAVTAFGEVLAVQVCSLSEAFNVNL